MLYDGHVVNTQDELKNAVILSQKKIYNRIKTFKIIALIFAEVLGLLSLFFAVTTFTGYNDSFPTYKKPSYEYYGGDAYSGIQHAGVDAANNIAEAGDLIKNYIYDFSYTFGAILLIAGLLIIVVSTFQLIKTVYTPIIVNKADVESIMGEKLLHFSISSGEPNQEMEIRK